MKLIIAEKPSVGQSIAKVVGATKREKGYMAGDGYLVTWCIGHLVNLAEPEEYDPSLEKWSLETLPIVPAVFHTSIKKPDQYAIVKALMEREDVTELVEATDAAREGELIFRLLYDSVGCTKPFRRLWVSSQVSEDIKSGLENMKSGAEYENLYRAAACRQRADWLLGINLTRLYTKLYARKLPTGRVQTPTVNLIVQRQREIDSFTPRSYFSIIADLDGFKAYTRVESKAQADAVISRCSGVEAYVSKVECVKKTVQPPPLYDLTTLQREANQKYGYTARQTLDYLQSLYEAKLITYPRSDSRYLTSEVAGKVTGVLGVILSAGFLPAEALGSYSVISADLNRITDDKKVSDHHAIIPTKEVTKETYEALPTGERNILTMVIYRLLVATSEPHIYESVTAILDIAGEAFEATGRTVCTPGFKAICQEEGPGEGEQERKPDNVWLPFLEGGNTRPVLSVRAEAKSTKPPQPYTDGSLLAAMESCGKTLADEGLREAMKDCGIGTVATRTGIIENIISSGYVRRDKKALLPTETGMLYIDLVPNTLKEPTLTAEWERELFQVERGELSREEFLNKVTTFLRTFIADTKLLSHAEERPFQQEREVLGTCPRCGKHVVEYPKSYACESGKSGCGFTIWKTTAEKSISKAQARNLLTKGRTDLIKGFISRKTGGSYSAYLVLREDATVGIEFPTK